MKTKTPTITVPAKSAATEPPVIELVPSLLRLRSILVPVDFSEHSRKAVRYAAAFAEQFGAKITLLNVSEPRLYAPDFAHVPLAMENDSDMDKRRKRLKALAGEAVEPRLLEKSLVRAGTPFHEITEAARTLKVDLIILGTHGYTGLKHVLLGSTAERVVRHAPCPVLVVRDHGQEFLPVVRSSGDKAAPTVT